MLHCQAANKNRLVADQVCDSNKFKAFLNWTAKIPFWLIFRFFSPLLFHSPFLPFHCSRGLSLLSHSCLLSPSHSIIAKSIWNCHWEQLSRNGFVHILKTVSVIKTQRFSTKNWLNIHVSGHWLPAGVLCWGNCWLGTTSEQHNHCTVKKTPLCFSYMCTPPKKSILCLSRTAMCVLHRLLHNLTELRGS